jgi:restriction endonuclease S subunit
MINSDIKLPQGWIVAKLDDLIIRMTNGANTTQFEEKIGMPISRIETIWNETIDFCRVKYIKESDHEFIEKYKLHNNDILFSHINSDNHIGKTAIYTHAEQTTLIHGINLLLLRPSKEISAVLLNYQLKYFRHKGAFAAVAQKAVNQSSINQVKLKSFDIFLPPLAEQHRIVGKIEELFSELDKGVESLKTAQQQLKVYRQAVLKYAFEGKLTNPEVKEGELPEGWESKTIGELVTKSTTKVYPNKNSDFVFLGMDSLAPHSTKPHYFHQFAEMKSTGNFFCSGQVLYGRMRPYLNKVWVADCNGVASGEFVVMTCSERILPNYLLNILHHQDFVSFANSKTSGDRPRISFDEISEFPLLLPIIEEQHAILQKIESRLSICDKIEETIQQGLQQAEALRQGILKKAFEGKLVPQDPSDEPASVLLDRIKAARAGQTATKKSRTKKVTLENEH